MAPVPSVVSGVHAFVIVDGLDGAAEPLDVSRSLRRAVMARVQAVVGEREKLAPFFSGHEENGAPLRRAGYSHLSFALEPTSRLLLVLAPHLIDHRSPTKEEREHLRYLDLALEGFRELRAGAAGLPTLSPGIVNN